MGLSETPLPEESLGVARMAEQADEAQRAREAMQERVTDAATPGAETRRSPELAAEAPGLSDAERSRIQEQLHAGYDASLRRQWQLRHSELGPQIPLSKDATFEVQPGSALQQHWSPEREAEFSRQVALQEEGANSLSVGEFTDVKERIGVAQHEMREQYKDDLARECRRQVLESEPCHPDGSALSPTEVDDLVQRETDQIASSEDALHNPDLVMGGHDRVGTMGDSGINRSLGKQFESLGPQVRALRDELRTGVEDGRIDPHARMHLRLQIKRK